MSDPSGHTSVATVNITAGARSSSGARRDETPAAGLID
jgi:hypothetical protein